MKKVDPVSVHLVLSTAALSLSLFFNSYRFSVFGLCECPLLKIVCLLFPEFGIYSSRTASSKREKL